MEPEEHRHMCSNPDGATLAELAALRQRVAELEADATEHECLLAQVQQESCSVRALAAEAHRRARPLDAIFDAIVDPIVIMDATGLPVRANQAAIAMFGLDPAGVELEALVGRLSIRQPDGRAVPDSQLPISRALRGEPVHGQHWMLTNARGQDLHILASVSPLIEQGRVFGIVALLHDISESTQMEQMLRDSELKFRSVVEGSADGIVLADEQGAIIEWNHAQEQITGLTRAEAVGRPVWDLVFQVMPEEQKAPALYEHLRASMIEFLRTGQAPWLNQLRENEVQRPDGTRRYVQETMFSIKTEKGCMSGSTLRDITERKQAEAALEASEARFRSLIETTGVGVAITDPGGHLVFVNQALCSMAGYSQEELVGKPFAGFLHPDEVETVGGLFQNAPRSPMARRTLDFRVMHKDGHVVHCQSSPTITRRQGKIAEFNALILDVSSRKRTEEALARERILLRTVIDNLPDAVYVKDTEGRKMLANPTEVHFGGFQVEAEMLGKTDLELYAPEVAACFAARDQAILQTGTPMLNYEEFLENANGEHNWWLTSQLPLRDESGQITGLVGISRDITERKRAEDALRKREQEMRAIADNVPGLVSYVDPDGCYRFVNKRYEEWFGVSQTESIGKHCREILGEAAYERVKDRVQAALSGERVYYEDALPYARGGVRWVSADYVPDIDEHGSVKGFFALVTDISERKQTQEEQDRLLEQVRAAQEELRKLAGYLQAAREEERSRVARELHDEFGQALTVLKMDLAWISKRLQPGQSKLREKARAMSDLLSSTLQTVRRVATELRPGLLDDLGLSAALEWQTQEFSERTGIACQADLGEGDISLGRDLDTTLFRICQETLTNIARHAEATQVYVELRAEPDSVTLTVRDNGKGITEYQISDPRSLGLTGIRERARAWGGEVTFEGMPGEGTTVRVLIPHGKKSAVQES